MVFCALKKEGRRSPFYTSPWRPLVSCISNWHQEPFSYKKNSISKQYREKINYFFPYFVSYVAQRRTQNHRRSEKEKYLSLLETVSAVERNVYCTKKCSLYTVYCFRLESTSLYSGQDVGWATGEPFWAPGMGGKDFPSSHNFLSPYAMDWLGCLYRCVVAEQEIDLH